MNSWRKLTMKRNDAFDKELFSQQFYNCADKQLIDYQLRCINEMDQYNKIPATQDGVKKRGEYLKELFASIGINCYIEPPMHANFGGKNVWIGDNFYANFNLVLVDDGKIEIGNNVMVGPNVTIATAEHPLKAEERNSENNQRNRPVKIGNNVWIGASVTILPGVTIGDNAVIGAGALVNRDIPANVMAAGVPARVIKIIEN